jgi:hypothetical protein
MSYDKAMNKVKAHSQKLKPKYVFLGTFVLLFLILQFTDYIFSSGPIPFTVDVGNIFLAQCLAVFVTTILVVARADWRKRWIPWATASVVGLLLIGASFNIYYTYPGILTEADGPASVRYSCMYGEEYNTVVKLTGSTYSDGGSTAVLCVLKNMPMAASNVLFIDNNAEESGQVLFGISEVIVLGSFLLARRLSSKARVR